MTHQRAKNPPFTTETGELAVSAPWVYNGSRLFPGKIYQGMGKSCVSRVVNSRQNFCEVAGNMHTKYHTFFEQFVGMIKSAFNSTRLEGEESKVIRYLMYFLLTYTVVTKNCSSYIGVFSYLIMTRCNFSLSCSQRNVNMANYRT